MAPITETSGSTPPPQPTPPLSPKGVRRGLLSAIALLASASIGYVWRTNPFLNAPYCTQGIEAAPRFPPFLGVQLYQEPAGALANRELTYWKGWDCSSVEGEFPERVTITHSEGTETVSPIESGGLNFVIQNKAGEITHMLKYNAVAKPFGDLFAQQKIFGGPKITRFTTKGAEMPFRAEDGTAYENLEGRLIEWMKGYVTFWRYTLSKGSANPWEEMNPHEIQKVVVLDLLIQNNDRHGGNLLTDGKTIVPIDHDEAGGHPLDPSILFDQDLTLFTKWKRGIATPVWRGEPGTWELACKPLSKDLQEWIETFDPMQLLSQVDGKAILKGHVYQLYYRHLAMKLAVANGAETSDLYTYFQKGHFSNAIEKAMERTKREPSRIADADCSARNEKIRNEFTVHFTAILQEFFSENWKARL